MIDADLIEQLDSGTQELVRSAIRLLASTGILRHQKQRLFERLATGSDTEDAQAVAVRVLEFRKESHGLEQLHLLGEQYLRELSQ